MFLKSVQIFTGAHGFMIISGCYFLARQNSHASGFFLQNPFTSALMLTIVKIYPLSMILLNTPPSPF